MVVRAESVFSTRAYPVEENELRWYHGARRPQQDAGVLFFRNKYLVSLEDEYRMSNYE
jgi:hypothetical protein